MTLKTENVKDLLVSDRIRVVAKESRITFRVGTELKKGLEFVAKKENRSVAQICETFLKAGLSGYAKEGTRYLTRLISSDHRE